MSVNYAYIENGEILERHYALPENWRHVSGLRLLVNDLSLLRSLGWYPVITLTVAYDTATEYISDYTYEFVGDQVNAIPVISARPPEPVIPFEDLKFAFMNYLREERNQRLSNTDWTRLDDNGLTFEQRESYRVYRQNLRDLPQIYGSNEVTDINQIVWPLVNL